MEKDVLAPGEEVDLEVTFLTETYFGHQYKVPVLTTNEPRPNFIRKVGVIADIVVYPDSTYPVVFRPHVLDFYRNGESGREKISFDIENASDETVEMKFIDFPGELIRVRLPRVIKRGETGKGYVYLKPQAVDKEFEKSFTIELMDEDATRFTIPVRRIKPTTKD